MSVKRARILRRNQTDAERKLWYALRSRRFDGFKFRRQVPIGPYFADFACMRERLIIEADGGQHGWRSEEDAERTKILEGHGFRVLRFWNTEILTNLDGVLTLIRLALPEIPTPDRRCAASPHPDPLPQGERGESDDVPGNGAGPR
jgi:very-short-patch-repair endonuclease